MIQFARMRTVQPATIRSIVAGACCEAFSAVVRRIGFRRLMQSIAVSINGARRELPAPQSQAPDSPAGSGGGGALQASPMPLPSAGSAFTVVGQLFRRSGTPSLSVWTSAAAPVFHGDPESHPAVRRAAASGGQPMTTGPAAPSEDRRGSTVGAARKRRGSPALGANAVGFKESAATKDAFQRNRAYAVAVEGPFVVEWQRWSTANGRSRLIPI